MHSRLSALDVGVEQREAKDHGQGRDGREGDAQEGDPLSPNSLALIIHYLKEKTLFDGQSIEESKNMLNDSKTFHWEKKLQATSNKRREVEH